MISFESVVKYFTVYVPLMLKLKLARQCGMVVKNILESELNDSNFLSWKDYTPRQRAEFSVITNGGTYFKRKKEFRKRVKFYRLIAEILILNHTAINHSERYTDIEKYRLTLVLSELKNHKLTSFEKQLISPITNAWSFEPSKNVKQPAVVI